jgi:hypothetical protein
MKFKNIFQLGLKLTSVLVASGIIFYQIAEPGLAESNLGNINGGNFRSNAGSFRDPGFIEPLGSQQFFKDNSYFIENNNSSKTPKENPLTIKDENLVPNELPSDRPTQNRDRPPQLPKSEDNE